jgi:two-component system, NtrC family, nitrogen regulation sensor histidine kinase GlnL
MAPGALYAAARLLCSFDGWSKFSHAMPLGTSRAQFETYLAEPPEAGPVPAHERMILNAIASSVLALDGELRVVFANSAAETLLGASSSLLAGRALDELVPFDSPLLDLVRRVQEAGSSISDYGVEVPLSRGAPRLMDLHVSLLAEVPAHVAVILHPCSVAHRLDRQLSHRGGARAVAGLAATLAHEVKNPLSGIRGAAQLLEPGVGDDERPLIRLICDEADRICALVDRMEQFADGQPIERRPVNIHRVLERVRGVAESGFARGLRFVERYDPSLPEVDGDHDQLVQVFLNLVKNAAEAVAPDGGEIRLSTQYIHGLWLRLPSSRERVELPIAVQVQDNGPGVAAELAGHLFEPFVTSKRSGNGLGLSLVAKIVGDHGGVVECENLMRGAVFRVRLPAWRGPAPLGP